MVNSTSGYSGTTLRQLAATLPAVVATVIVFWCEGTETLFRFWAPLLFRSRMDFPVVLRYFHPFLFPSIH